MSTREQHPIDDHFRRSLAAAEVEPPAHVWAGVAAAQRGSGRRWGLWFWPLLLLVGAGVAGAFQFFGTPDGLLDVGEAVETAEDPRGRIPSQTEAVPSVADTDVTPTVDPSIPYAASVGQETTEGGTVRMVKRDAITAVPTDVAPIRGSSPVSAASDPPDVSNASDDADTMAGSSMVSASADVPVRSFGITPDHAQPTGIIERAAPDQAMEERSAWAEGISLRPELMSILPSTRVIPEFDREVYRSNLTPESYVLPHGEWWVGPAAGFFSSKLRWKGDDAELAEAINKTMSTRTEPAFGLAFGYTWRSGWGISSGLFWQQGEQQRRLSDRRTDVEQEIISSVVSLDAQVIVSSTDTLITTTTTETEFSGVERSTVLRIPIQGHWHGDRGRLLYGAQLGLVVERSSFRGGPTLVRDASDGRIVPVSDASVSGQDRQPLTLSGSAGLELGYQLHERWVLRGGPLLMHGLASMQRPENVFALPDRLGLQFLLVHNIHRRSFR